MGCPAGYDVTLCATMPVAHGGHAADPPYSGQLRNEPELSLTG